MFYVHMRVYLYMHMHNICSLFFSKQGKMRIISFYIFILMLYIHFFSEIHGINM